MKWIEELGYAVEDPIIPSWMEGMVPDTLPCQSTHPRIMMRFDYFSEGRWRTKGVEMQCELPMGHSVASGLPSPHQNGPHTWLQEKE